MFGCCCPTSKPILPVASVICSATTVSVVPSASALRVASTPLGATTTCSSVNATPISSTLWWTCTTLVSALFTGRLNLRTVLLLSGQSLHSSTLCKAIGVGWRASAVAEADLVASHGPDGDEQ